MTRKWIIACLVLAACALEPGIAEYNQGIEHLSAGKTELAEASFKRALEKKSDFAEAHLNLGKIYLEKGWTEGAEKSTQTALSIFESSQTTASTDTSWRMGASLASTNLGLIKLNTFKAEMEKLGAWSSLALMAGNSKVEQVDDALMLFERAIELDPSNSTAQGEIQKIKENPYLWSEAWSKERRKAMGVRPAQGEDIE